MEASDPKCVTPMIINMGLTHLGSEASIWIQVMQLNLKDSNFKTIKYKIQIYGSINVKTTLIIGFYITHEFLYLNIVITIILML